MVITPRPFSATDLPSLANLPGIMATEIERKFLISSDAWRAGPPGVWICQGYLCLDPERTVRIRVKGDEGFITIKGASEGIGRKEFEYPIPLGDATELLEMCHQPLLEKVRHERQVGGHCWEIDEFHGANEGLIMAEIELGSEDEAFEKPEWAGREVSDDPRYYNSALAQNPWQAWGASEAPTG